MEGREVGGKTGTTQSYKDAWFIGYTAQYVAGVWVGNDDSKPTKRVTGGSLPAQIWKDVMLAAHANLPAVPLPGEPPSSDSDYLNQDSWPIDDLSKAPAVPKRQSPHSSRISSATGAKIRRWI